MVYMNLDKTFKKNTNLWVISNTSPFISVSNVHATLLERQGESSIGSHTLRIVIFRNKEGFSDDVRKYLENVTEYTDYPIFFTSIVLTRGIVAIMACKKVYIFWIYWTTYNKVRWPHCLHEQCMIINYYKKF